jgi:hypothetical protein
MKKVWLYILWVILFVLFLVGMIKLLGGCNQNISCVKEEVQVANIPVVVPQQKPVKSAELISPKTRIVEKEIRSGNKGYFMLDTKYVYFGINKTIREEVPVK